MSALLGWLIPRLGIKFTSSLCSQFDSLPPSNGAFLGREGGCGRGGFNGTWSVGEGQSSAPTSAALLSVRHSKAAVFPPGPIPSAGHW